MLRATREGVKTSLIVRKPAWAGKPLATLSLDLDNRWSYLKTHGDVNWETAPSYLPIVVRRVLDILDTLGVYITWFIVGRDAANREDAVVLKTISDAGHELGNHSFLHEPWLHLYDEERLEKEIAWAEQAIAEATGQKPVGFRGPGFSHSDMLFTILADKGYLYDASVLPTFIGPLARTYYFLTADLAGEQRKQRRALFGSVRDVFRSNVPRRKRIGTRNIWEVPVTTMPVFRTPIHVSYLLFLSTFSEKLADFYCQLSLLLCRITGTPPSWLLHPLDFLGRDEAADLDFFPAMNLPTSIKVARVIRWLRMLMGNYRVVPIRSFVEQQAVCGRDGSCQDVAAEACVL